MPPPQAKPKPSASRSPWSRGQQLRPKRKCKASGKSAERVNLMRRATESEQRHYERDIDDYYIDEYLRKEYLKLWREMRDWMESTRNPCFVPGPFLMESWFDTLLETQAVRRMSIRKMRERYEQEYKTLKTSLAAEKKNVERLKGVIDDVKTVMARKDKVISGVRQLKWIKRANTLLTAVATLGLKPTLDGVARVVSSIARRQWSQTEWDHIEGAVERLAEYYVDCTLASEGFSSEAQLRSRLKSDMQRVTQLMIRIGRLADRYQATYGKDDRNVWLYLAMDL